MSSPQKGICTVCGTDTGDKRRSRCDLHRNTCRICGTPIKDHRWAYCTSCGCNPNFTLARSERDDGIATVRRLFALRQRAEAGLSLFERNERAKTG